MEAVDGASSPPSTSSPFASASSGYLGLFEAFALVVFGLSLFWMRRRRRQLEVRTEQRYDRLSRVEMGAVSSALDPPQDNNGTSPSSSTGVVGISNS